MEEALSSVEPNYVVHLEHNGIRVLARLRVEELDLPARSCTSKFMPDGSCAANAAGGRCQANFCPLTQSGYWVQ